MEKIKEPESWFQWQIQTDYGFVLEYYDSYKAELPLNFNSLWLSSGSCVGCKITSIKILLLKSVQVDVSQMSTQPIAAHRRMLLDFPTDPQNSLPPNDYFTPRKSWDEPILSKGRKRLRQRSHGQKCGFAVTSGAVSWAGTTGIFKILWGPRFECPYAEMDWS